MAWGRSKAVPPPEASTLGKILPLLIVLVILAGGAWVGYQVYLSARQIGDQASERMGKKNVVFTKDGLKVGVKQIQDEKYVDNTQKWVMKAWTLGNSREDADLKKQKEASKKK